MSNPTSAEALAAQRKRFEHWYTTHAFDYSRDPVGSRDCSLQWVAWQAALASSGQAASAVPEGWKIRPLDRPPFKAFEVIAPNGYATVAYSHARNPENIIYMLAEALLATPAAPAQPRDEQAQAAELTNAARDVLAERQRQIEKEGWTPKHDDEHNGEEMALAAVCYLLCYAKPQPEWLPYGGDKKPPRWWPWDEADWKPKGPRRDLVRAGALILAELERLDRASSTTGSNT